MDRSARTATREMIRGRHTGSSSAQNADRSALADGNAARSIVARISEGELAMLQTSGCDFGALGPLTLRTELASIAALGSA